jgi:hypothetical protein
MKPVALRSRAGLVLLAALVGIAPGWAQQGGALSDPVTQQSPPGKTVVAPPPAETTPVAERPPLMDQALRTWKNWEPVVTRGTQRLQKEYDDYNKWDYQILAIGADDAAALLARMNALGEQGW